MVMREPVMKGIVQEFCHQHNKYCRYSMAIKMKENIVGFDASPTAMFFLGYLQAQSETLLEIAW